MRRQFISVSAAVIVLVVCAAEITNGEVPKFEVGKSYTFDFNSEVRASSKGLWSDVTADEIADGLTIETKAQVVIRGLTETEFLLTFKDGELKTRSLAKDSQEGPPASVKMDNSILKFTYVDGVVTSTASNPDEPTWSVNIKRGILSLLQNKAFSSSMDKGTDVEESVLGQCVTTYSLSTSDSGSEYKKEIVLNECGLSEGSDIISQGVPYQLPLVTNKPVFGFLRSPSSVIECRQSVSKESILTSAVCADKDSGHSILHHKQQSSLTFVDSSSDSGAMPEDAEMAKLTLTRESLLYDFISAQQPTGDAEKVALEKLTALLGQEEFDMNTKDELSFFSDFKSQISQVSDLSGLKELVDKSPRKKIFYDAAAEVGTDSAILFLVQADKANELDLTTKLTFYGTLPFVKRPGLKAIAALTDLVKEAKVPAQPETMSGEAMQIFAKDVSLIQHLLLGVSGAAYRYCMQSDNSCGNKPEYMALIDSVASHVKEGETLGAEIDVTLAALYALGNTVSLTPEAVKKLESLIASETLMAPIRLAAIDAFRRDPCQPELVEKVKNILADKANTNYEIRIQAYLATAKCLTPSTIEAIKGVLKEETENTVLTGFIASHIRNIVASTSPSTATLREQLKSAEIEIPQTIAANPETPRVSTFIEHSTFRHKENVGFSGTMTVFFASGQTRPQFVSFNKTIDLFGKSYNFIEVGLSQRMLPSTRIFHPDSSPADWSSLMHRAMHAKDSYIRVFGTTVAMGMDGIHKAMQLAFFKISNGTIFMDLIQPATILDEKLSTTTVTGLPLTLGMDATYLKALKLEMTAEPVKKLVNSLFALAPEEGQDFDLKLDMKVHASALMVASAGIGGDDSPIRIGYAVEGRMDKKYTWGVEAISSRPSPDESSVTFKLNFPEETIASKKISGKVYSFQEVNGVNAAAVEGSTAVAVPPKMSVDAKCESCVVFGLKNCANVTIPESRRRMFPFSVAFSIGKVEESVTGFVVTSSVKRETVDTDGNMKSVHTLSVSTPGSSNPRELKSSIVQTLETYGRSVTVEVDTALNQETVKGIFKLNMSRDPSIYLGFGKNSNPVEGVVDIKFTSGEREKWALNGKFGEPLSYFAEELNVVGDTERVNWYSEDNEKYSNYTNRQSIGAKLTSKYLNNPSLEEEFLYFSEKVQDDKTSTRRHDNLITIKLITGEEVWEVKGGKNITYVYPNEEQYTFGLHTKHPYNFKVAHDLSLVVVSPTTRPMSLGVNYVLADEVEQGKNIMNLSVTVDSGCPITGCDPIKCDIGLEGKLRDWGTYNGSIEVNLLDKEMGYVKKEQVGKMGLRIDNYFKSINVYGDIKGISDFKGSVEVESEKKSHVHIDVNILPSQKSVSIDVDYADDGNVINEQTSAILTTGHGESVITKNTSTVVNRAERSFKHQGTVTDNKGTVLQSLHMEAQLQPSFESSGVSTFSWDFHTAKGSFCQGTLNKTLTLSPPIYKSVVEAEVNAGRKPEKKEPIRFRKEVTYDSTVGPEYAAQGHVSVVEKITSRALNMDVSKELSWSVKKDEPEAKLVATSNATFGNGEIVTSSLEGEWKGNKEDKTKGEITLIGKLQDPRQNGEGDFKISYEGDIKTLQTVRAEGEVTTTPVSTGDKKQLALLNATKTVKVPKWPLMSVAEIGSLKLPQQDSEFLWSQEFVISQREFVFHKDVKVMKGGVEKFEEDFLIHVSVRMDGDDGEMQKKLTLQTDHNFNPSNPNCPFRKMNVTLSR